MPKRRNPFSDSPFLQKIHVGQKEVDLGVNHEENMKKVYENTLKMLFNGSMKNQPKIVKVQNVISTFQNSASDLSIQNGASAAYNGLSAYQNKTPTVCNELLYQNGTSAVSNKLSPYQNGVLAAHNETSGYQNGMSTFSNGTSPITNGLAVGQRYFHQKIGGNKNEKLDMVIPCCKSNPQILCSFCERVICVICARICENCSFKFCHLCSVLKYDLQEETAVCLSCT